MTRLIVKKGRLETFIYLCLLFKEFHVRLVKNVVS